MVYKGDIESRFFGEILPMPIFYTGLVSEAYLFRNEGYGKDNKRARLHFCSRLAGVRPSFPGD